MSIRVLVPDPDELLLEVFEQSLARHGFEVFTATAGEDCLEKLREYLPHVLVIEPDLPDDLGARVIQLIIENSHVPTVPVVIVSRHEREQSVVPLDTLIGAYHVKPVSMDLLAQSIRSAVDAGP